MIGQRTLRTRRKGLEVDITISAETPEGQGRAWICRWSIDWPEGRIARFARGIDGLQAAHLAQQMIGAALYSSEDHKAGHLVWEKPGDGYGFPVPKAIRDRLVGADRTYE